MPDREHREKASEVFMKSPQVFGSRGSFAEVFPTVGSVRIEYRRAQLGSPPAKYPFVLSQGDFGQFINCDNSLCYNGGFAIGDVISEMVHTKQVEREFVTRCQGYEGSPKGRRKYRDCVTMFSGRVTIEYRDMSGATED